MKSDEKRLHFAFKPQQPAPTDKASTEPIGEGKFPLPPMHPQSLLAQGWNWLKQEDTREIERLRLLIPNRCLTDSFGVIESMQSEG